MINKCLRSQTHKTNKTQEICVENQFPTNSINYLNICYLNDIEEHCINVWFTIGRSLNDTFDYYRFTLRSIDHALLSHKVIETLTNFTKLMDLNNSLRMFNLGTGEYEVCVEFQSDFPQFIYQPRDGCISIVIGHVIHHIFEQNSTPLLIILAITIVIFFVLGLVVQSVKKKRQKRLQKDENEIPSSEQHRENLIKIFFRRYIDQPRTSRLRQWARNQAFRHRISNEEQESERPNLLRNWSRYVLTSLSRHRMPNTEPVLTRNAIRMISVCENEHPTNLSTTTTIRKVVFDLSSSSSDE
jgi:hypothetical protein